MNQPLEGQGEPPIGFISRRSLDRLDGAAQAQVWVHADDDEIYCVPLYAAAQPPEPVGEALREAFKLGFIAAANWALRHDLIADTDSPAYIRERDAALRALPAEPVGEAPVFQKWWNSVGWKLAGPNPMHWARDGWDAALRALPVPQPAIVCVHCGREWKEHGAARNRCPFRETHYETAPEDLGHETERSVTESTSAQALRDARALKFYAWLREKIRTKDGLIEAQALLWNNAPGSRRQFDEAVDKALGASRLAPEALRSDERKLVDETVDGIAALLGGQDHQAEPSQPDRPLPPLPELDPKRQLSYDQIRYVAGFHEGYVQEYAVAYARAALTERPAK